MLYPWVKTVVGVLLAANFCLPLITVASNRHLWEEPMAVLAGNMSLTSTLVGIVVALIGIYDLADFQSIALCQLLQYSSVGIGMAFKVAQLGAAVDQFVAVVYPLSHYPIMMRYLPRLFTATWLTCTVILVVGFVAHMLDMETLSDRIINPGNYSTFTGCRWETSLAYYPTIVFELETVVISLVTASLLIYAGVVGYRIKARLVREEQQLRHDGVIDDSYNQAFLDNYRAFKSIMTVLSLTVSMDIVSPILRISSRWYPQPKLNGMLHQMRLFGFIFEGWAYGLLNAKLRAAYKKTLCGASRRARNADMEQILPPKRKTTASAAAAVAPLELCSVGSSEADGRF